MKYLVCAAALLFPLAIPLSASGHIQLLEPTPRYLDLKYGPCGKGTVKDVRTANVHTLESGQKLKIRFKETVPHPGHYRVSFDDDGQDLFTNPSSFTDVAPRAGVLLDDIKDKDGTQEYTVEVTLPDVECNNCTLQVIQVMTDKPPYNPDYLLGDDIYYQCADLVLKRRPGTDMAQPQDLAAGSQDLAAGPADLATGAPDLAAPAMEGGCQAAGPAAPSPLSLTLLLGLCALLLRRRPAG